MQVSDMPEWCHAAFKGMKSLNRVQSRIYDCALKVTCRMSLQRVCRLQSRAWSVRV
jgi:hypothetical protein